MNHCSCRHDPPLFAQCDGQVPAGEMLCAWCKGGHTSWLGLIAAFGRATRHALRLWAERTSK